MTVALAAVALLLALVFLSAITSHVREPQRIRHVVEEIGLPPLFAWFALAIQSAIVPLLVLAPQLGFLVAATFLGAVSGTFVISGMLGRTHSDCGCFSIPHAVDGAFFVRNALLGGVALAGWSWGPRGYVAPGLAVAAIAVLMSLVLNARRSGDVTTESAVHFTPHS